MNVWTYGRKRWFGQPRAIILVALLLLAASAGCTAAETQSNGQSTPTTTEALAAPTSTQPPATPTTAPATMEMVEATIPSGWLTHTNQSCDYAISYPPEMQIADQDANSQILAFSVDDPGGAARNFIYVSTIDQNGPDTGEGIVYNYDPAETELLLGMQVGESRPSRDIADVAEWFTYERKPDTPLAGHDAQTYENAKPWEFPEGTKEIRYYLSLNGCTYLIGAYLDATGSSQPGAINEALFDQIVATIQLP
jgi:hypothetical protein